MSVLDKPLVDLYADELTSSFGPATAGGLSRLLSAGLSQDKMTRFLSARALPSTPLWPIVRPLVREVQSENAVLVINESSVQNPQTDPGDLIGWRYDHTTGTSIKGINFLTALYCVEDVSLPP